MSSDEQPTQPEDTPDTLRNDTQLLDPLSSLIRIYSLAFKPESTKIFVYNHAICFNLPDWEQGVSRRIVYRVSRQDIHFLKSVILNFIQHYNFEHPQINFLVRGAVKGLQRFLGCYKSAGPSVVRDSIEYYILLLQTELQRVAVRSHTRTASPAAQIKPLTQVEDDGDEEEQEEKENDNNSLERDPNPSPRESKTVTISILKNPLDSPEHNHDKITKDIVSLWTPQHVNIVHAIFLELENQQTQHDTHESSGLLASVEDFLRSKDKRVARIAMENA